MCFQKVYITITLYWDVIRSAQTIRGDDFRWKVSNQLYVSSKIHTNVSFWQKIYATYGNLYFISVITHPEYLDTVGQTKSQFFFGHNHIIIKYILHDWRNSYTMMQTNSTNCQRTLIFENCGFKHFYTKKASFHKNKCFLNWNIYSVFSDQTYTKTTKDET